MFDSFKLTLSRHKHDVIGLRTLLPEAFVLI